MGDGNGDGDGTMPVIVAAMATTVAAVAMEAAMAGEECLDGVTSCAGIWIVRCQRVAAKSQKPFGNINRQQGTMSLMLS